MHKFEKKVVVAEKKMVEKKADPKPEKKPYQYITKDRMFYVWQVKSVKPKTCTVKVGMQPDKTTELTLSLTPRTYNILTSIVCFVDKKNKPPYLFTINEKGSVTEIISTYILQPEWFRGKIIKF